jgi:hypothetical protein
MKGLVLNLFLFFTVMVVPAFAQQGTVPASQSGSVSWGWMMVLGLIAGMAAGAIVRPRKINQPERIERHDRAA